MDDRYDPLLRRTADLALDFIDHLPERAVAPPVEIDTLAALDGPLPDEGEDPVAVIERLVRDADPGITASAGPRYFGFVTGGALPAALAADWLTATWDQVAGMYIETPALAVVEGTAARWLLDLFGLPGPETTSVGFTTGCTMAHLTGLAAARHALLARAGWDVEARGLFGAPEIAVIVGDEAHVSIFAVLQMLGFGAERVTRIEADGQGRMRADALAAAIDGRDGPTIVCAQAGNVNTGAFDPLAEIAETCRARGVWLHVDGAFGLWAAATPALRHLVAGVEGADSWASDAHKWLNVPYDSGIVMVADKDAHGSAMKRWGTYLVPSDDPAIDGSNWVPESSRRARGLAIYAALRSLGRKGVAAMIERNCALARRMAERLAAAPGVDILNDVVLNQVLVRFSPGDGADAAAADALTRDVIARVQAEGTCWLGGTTWHGMDSMRVSVSNWSTTEADIDRSAEAILGCYAPARGAAVKGNER